MTLVTDIVIAIVALLHLYFLWLEMFVWTTKAKKVFKNFPKDLFEPTKAMAANQGLYNGFLAAGLIWSLLIADPLWQIYVGIFFLSCVFIAGAYGAYSISKKILVVQSFPALIGLLLLLVQLYS
ncbi:MAG: DUF1304 domain-containing protein [Croceitalea sp.]|nr:DUF1304 domain-containing protein [Croceitalea sp.]MBT8237389.1 DUF1304 domain-containing protein [Croceitalea sp.]NNL09459.1 DUF1304 domain-containing protein [Croceitalea sp.]NNM17955.1 DUF1304 domain-containing protein [Croceitalea sp.]